MIHNAAIDITNHCNFECVHCLRDKKSPRMHMDLDVFTSICDGISSVGIQNVCLTGGEAALYPKLNHAFEIIADHGIFFSMVTNGFLFEEKIRPLLKLKIKKYFTGICFSLDGATSASHDMIRRKGSFDKVINAIDACVKEEIPVSVKSIVHRENRNEMVDLAHLCASKGVQSLGYVLLTPTPRLLSRNLMPTSEEYMTTIKYIRGRVMPSFSMNINIEGYADPDYRLSFCNPAYGISFDHLGNFIFCCNLSHPTNGDHPNVLGRECLGNIGEIGIEEGILRHYRTLAWFMDQVVHSDIQKDGPVNCTKCYRLFRKTEMDQIG
jgi:MoaA/NifB/PqqE/SkfB family radical SAM enzyme